MEDCQEESKAIENQPSRPLKERKIVFIKRTVIEASKEESKAEKVVSPQESEGQDEASTSISKTTKDVPKPGKFKLG